MTAWPITVSTIGSAHLYTRSFETPVPPRVTWHGWVSQAELAQAMASADILFLPYSFLPAERSFRATSFPAKTADYLASGRPILIFSPPDSSIVEYAREFAFACIVPSLRRRRWPPGSARSAVQRHTAMVWQRTPCARWPPTTPRAASASACTTLLAAAGKPRALQCPFRPAYRGPMPAGVVRDKA